MTDSKAKIAKAGKLLMADTGEYSDYMVIAFFVVLKDFDPMQELEEYRIANPDQAEDYGFKENAFLAWLTAKGYLLEVEYGNLFLGSYATCDDVRFTSGP